MKKFLSLVLALVMTMSLVTISAGAKDFTDGSKVKYTEAVDVMSAVKVIDGYTDGSFRPTTELNRGAAAKIICNMILGPTTASALNATSAPFKDVPADSVFAGYITYCAKEKIINGYSDGTFRPTAPLTGYAFMKMLLGALGYDADQEGFTGANWGVNVAKQAIGIGLDDGNDDFNGSKYVTREEACLYAFNTLQATMVEYGSKTTVNVNGATVVVGGSEADEVSGRGYKSYNGESDNETLEFCEKYFTNLKLKDNDADDFGRPANTWRVKSKDVGTYAQTPDLTYTVKVELGDVYKDLGKPTMDNVTNDTDGDTVVYTNGDAHKVLVNKIEDNEDEIGGKGTITEVYAKDTGDYVKVTAVVIDVFASKIESVTEAKGDDDRYVTVERTVDTDDWDADFETEEFDEGDYVLFTVANGEIKSMKAAEAVKNVNIEKANVTKRTFTADGKTYEMSATCPTDNVGYDNDVDVYMDENGYAALVVEAEEAESQFAVVYAFRGDDWNSVDPDEAVSVRMVLSDGSKANGNMTNLTDDMKKLVDDKSDSTDESGVLVAYTYDEDKDEYDVDEGAERPVSADSIKKGQAKIDANTYGTSKTVYFYQDKDNLSTYDVYVGHKNAPSVENAKIYAIMDGSSKYAKAVLVSGDYDASGSADDLTFVVVSEGGVQVDAKHDYYAYNAIMDKEIGSFQVKVSSGAVDCTNFNTSAEYMLLKSYKTSNGNATEVTVATDTADLTILDSVKVTKAYNSDKGVIELAGMGYDFSEECGYFTVDEDGEISKASASKMYKGDRVVAVVNEDGVIDLIVNVEDLLG